MKAIAIRNGIYMALGFTLYFLIMMALDLGHNYYFRVFNGVIHVAFIAIAIKQYKVGYPEEFNYLSGVAMGITSSLVGIVPFSIFMLIFLASSPEFMHSLAESSELIGQYLTPFTASLIVLLEGMGISFLASYIIMRLVDSYSFSNGNP